MFKHQTSRKNFLLTKSLAAFLAVGAFSMTARAEISRCEGIFESIDVASALEAPVADWFWLRTSKIPSAEAFSAGVIAELRKRTDEQPIYRLLILPAIWNYARLSVEVETTSDPVTKMVNRIQDQVRTELARVNPRGNDHVRPKVMTADERNEAIALGHYGMIDGARLPKIKSEAQKKREALDLMISQALRAYTEQGQSPAVTNPLRDLFVQMQRWHVKEPMIAKSAIDALLGDSTDFAIVYAQHQGLTANAGQQGDMLSARVPWMRPARNPERFRVLSDMVALARALNHGPEATRTADVLVLETLRRAFAPDLTEFLP